MMLFDNDTKLRLVLGGGERLERQLTRHGSFSTTLFRSEVTSGKKAKTLRPPSVLRRSLAC
jgi:hypothetical protein